MHRHFLSLFLIASLVLVGSAPAWSQDYPPAPAAYAQPQGENETPAPQGPAAQKFAATLRPMVRGRAGVIKTGPPSACRPVAASSCALRFSALRT